MTILNKKEPVLLFLGDILAFTLSLWLTLFVRYGTFPSFELLKSHLMPFGILFVVWILAFYIAGLYEKHTVILRNRLPSIIFNTQVANTLVAFMFFYFIPQFGITPKTTLLIYLIVSFGVVLLWRLYGVDFLSFKNRQKAILVGSGEEMKELYEEVNKNDRYNLSFVSSLDLDNIEHFDFQEEIVKRVYSEGITMIVVDLNHKKVEPVLSRFYNLIFSRVVFIDMHKVYEDIFDRVPISLLKDSWFIENISTSPKVTYDALKRIMDIFLGSILGLISLVFYPFIYIAIKLDDGGPIFIKQERIGKDNKIIKITKVRTMSVEESVDLKHDSEKRITRVGNFLRKSRIDEIPQIWSIIKGDQSLIGPRPELPSLVKHYEEEISYYPVRHLIKPGLSGWAQIYHDAHPHHGIAIEETKEKLSYDLYYLKNRSFMLDLKISLRTIAQLLSRKGR